MRYKIIRKSFGKTLLSVIFSSFVATLAATATNNISQVQHVIIVVQENRTPDNLFNEEAVLAANGAHVQPSFPPPASPNWAPCHQSLVQMQPTPLYTCWDPDHSRGTQTNPGAWVLTWDGGKMDGACNVTIFYSCSAACTSNGPNNSTTCPYTYVDNTVWNSVVPYDRILDPYFQIAETYGFANFMFATNQGPSFPAHQFLFSGTSVPVFYQDTAGNCGKDKHDHKYDCWEYFAAENAHAKPTGCIADEGTKVYVIDTNGVESWDWFDPTLGQSFPCFDHGTLSDLLDANGISWRYYVHYNGAADLWTAPNAIQHICQPSGYGPNGICQGPAFTGKAPIPPNVVVPNYDWPNNTGDDAPILTDIEQCQLAAVSWVTPDGHWSDHSNYAGDTVGDGGPSWVAAIVNALGNNPACPNTGEVYWNDTVILVTWDDWGGYYDDVPPPDCTTSPCTGYFNGNYNGQYYVYGFRVPLLVIGAYTKTTANGKDGFTGYISGANVNPTTLNCQNQNYCHDFDSILNFIEYAFGLPQGGIGNPNWPYADYFAMDGPYNCPSCTPPYSLSDFFNFTQSGFHSFQTIQGAKYLEPCFHNPNQQGCFPDTGPWDPDDDANE